MRLLLSIFMDHWPHKSKPRPSQQVTRSDPRRITKNVIYNRTHPQSMDLSEKGGNNRYTFSFVNVWAIYMIYI